MEWVRRRSPQTAAKFSRGGHAAAGNKKNKEAGAKETKAARKRQREETQEFFDGLEGDDGVFEDEGCVKRWKSAPQKSQTARRSGGKGRGAGEGEGEGEARARARRGRGRGRVGRRGRGRGRGRGEQFVRHEWGRVE